MKRNAWYLILLPIFFVLHGFVENYGFISLGDCALLCIVYLLITVVLCGCLFLFFRKWRKAAFYSFALMSFYFFYSALHDFLKLHIPLRLLSRHSFLLTFFIIFFILLAIFLKRSGKPLYRLTLFLNLLLAIYILSDLVGAIAKSINKKQNSLSVYKFSSALQYRKCDSCVKPNIYFLLFDEYSSSVSLKQEYGFQNDLDSFLSEKKFDILQHSQANYNFTPFSMASLLNMAYIKGIKNVKAVTPEDYSNSYLLIKENEVMRYLDQQGYETRNYSIFNLAGHPTLLMQSFLPVNTMLITDRTLIPALRKDIGWIFFNSFPLKYFFKDYFLKEKRNNEQLIQLVKKTAVEKRKQPIFVYAHFLLPHAPFFFDKHGNARDNKTVYAEFVGEAPISSYLDYVAYANTRIKEMVNTILQNDPSAVIILLGDHGYRRINVSTPRRLFENLNAVYFPDKDYHSFYDSVTNVNEFPIVLNKLFGQQFALQEDSTIVLHDKK